MNISLPPLAWHHTSAPVIRSAQVLSEGDFCTCYLVNQTHVLRIAKHAEASASLRREMLLLPDLKGCIDVHIPLIQGAGIRVDSGEQFVFYPLVPGTILEPEVISSLDTTCRSNLVRQMAGFVTQLHSFPVERARSYGLKEMNPRHYLPELMDRARDGISYRLDRDVWRYYQRLVEFYLDTPEFHAYTPALLHGDLSPGHFLGDVERCVLTGVIDFGDSFIGDPYWDLIFVLEDYGKDILELFLTFHSPGTEQHARKRVQLFQQLDNVAYCLSRLSDGNPEAFEEALRILVTQATSQSIL